MSTEPESSLPIPPLTGLSVQAALNALGTDLKLGEVESTSSPLATAEVITSASGHASEEVKEHHPDTLAGTNIEMNKVVAVVLQPVGAADV